MVGRDRERQKYKNFLESNRTIEGGNEFIEKKISRDEWKKHFRKQCCCRDTQEKTQEKKREEYEQRKEERE